MGKRQPEVVVGPGPEVDWCLQRPLGRAPAGLRWYLGKYNGLLVAQRGTARCPRSLSQEVGKMGFEAQDT